MGGDDMPALIPDQGGCGFQGLPVDVIYDQANALFGKPERNGLADAGTGARDDTDMVVEASQEISSWIPEA